VGHTSKNKQLKTFQVAFYGSVKGKQKRIQTVGTEKELYQVAPLILGNNFSNDILSVIIGNWSKNTVQIDFDKMPFDKVKYYAHRVNNFFFGGKSGFIIFESSKTERVAKEKGKKGKVTYRYFERNYLVAFDKKVTWTKNVHIMNWIALESGSVDLKQWVTMQCIKESSTLRFSPKIDKPSPKIVYRYGSQNNQIKELLATRRIILNIVKNSLKKSVDSNVKAVNEVIECQ
jgi:hypothetical protein